MGDDVLGGFDESRRAFLKKALGVAFVAPAVVSFTMDALFEPAQAAPNMTCPNQTFPNQFTCTPANTITGPVYGNVIVNSGSKCIKGATIYGNVSISNGADVNIEDSTLKAGLASNGGGTLLLTGTSVAGQVNVNGNTGFVRIGGSGGDANILSNSLALTNNLGGLLVENNQIAGSVSVVNNTGGCDIRVINNTIKGSLSGSGNNPPAQASGNTVSGQKAGEFANT
jgi:hypothetical protein